MNRREVLRLALLGTLGWACRTPPATPSPADEALGRAIGWLWSRQTADGAVPSATYGFLRGGQSTTPFAITSILGAPSVPVESERLSRALSWMLSALDAHGALGFAADAPDYPVYATSLMLTALGTVRPRGWEEAAAPSIAWLRGQQVSPATGWTGTGLGGFPMGKPLPPAPGTSLHLDLSMTRRAIEALRAVGATPDDPAVALAKGFVERCRAPNGGYVYSPVDDALNKGVREGDVAQGYGSATTDGVQALLACGVAKSDPLVADAVKWLVANHRTDVNPGIGGGPLEGFAKAMRFYYRAGAAEVFAACGGPDGWREGMVAALLAEQRADGSFANEEVLQKEDDPVIATSFAVQALAATAR